VWRNLNLFCLKKLVTVWPSIEMIAGNFNAGSHLAFYRLLRDHHFLFQMKIVMNVSRAARTQSGSAPRAQ
jgi:hypothetical protein